VGLGEPRIETERRLDGIPGFNIFPHHGVDVGQARIGPGVLGIGGDGLLEILLGLAITGFVPPVPGLTALNIKPVGVRVPRKISGFRDSQNDISGT